MTNAVRQFLNERGNDISLVAKRGPLDDEVTVTLIGPTSETENTMTKREAEEMIFAVRQIFKL